MRIYIYIYITSYTYIQTYMHTYIFVCIYKYMIWASLIRKCTVLQVTVFFETASRNGATALLLRLGKWVMAEGDFRCPDWGCTAGNAIIRSHSFAWHLCCPRCTLRTRYTNIEVSQLVGAYRLMRLLFGGLTVTVIQRALHQEHHGQMKCFKA